MKTILSCLTTEEHADDILSAAVPLARRNMAHLIGFHTTETPVMYPGVYMHIPHSVHSSFESSQQEISKAIQSAFEDRVKNEDFVSEWRCERAQTMTAADRMVEAARTVDLVIMAQADATVDRADQHHAQEHVIRHSGRPVLHVPAKYRGEEIGRSVVIGWSPTREATRAAHDALPLLMEGAEVAIVSVSHDSEVAGASELARMFDRHGFKAEVVERHPGQSGIAEVLEREALERGSDLIVTGAFGHSRVYDFVVGAVTLELMRSAAVPVLFSR